MKSSFLPSLCRQWCFAEVNNEARDLLKLVKVNVDNFDISIQLKYVLKKHDFLCEGLTKHTCFVKIDFFNRSTVDLLLTSYLHYIVYLCIVSKIYSNIFSNTELSRVFFVVERYFQKRYILLTIHFGCMM